MRQLTVTRDEPLLAYLLEVLQLKRRAVKNLLAFGAVTVNGATTRQFDHPLFVGDRVTIGNLQTVAANERLALARIQLIYEDAAIIVLDKPAGLLTVATERNETDTLYFRLNQFLSRRAAAKGDRALIVHRLDQETSGLVLFAKSARVKRLLQAEWPAVEKKYWAVVEGAPPHDEGSITSYLTETRALEVFSNRNESEGSRRATTHYRRLETRSGLSLLEVRLETGRKHQIRVHLAELGCPVAGDQRYNAKSDPCHRLGLHAGSLALAHPETAEQHRFTSPLPKALGKLFSRTSMGIDA
jgi:23S rRNA pseudouridine1911/1915/1917 synthase